MNIHSIPYTMPVYLGTITDKTFEQVHFYLQPGDYINLDELKDQIRTIEGFDVIIICEKPSDEVKCQPYCFYPLQFHEMNYVINVMRKRIMWCVKDYVVQFSIIF